MKRIDRSLWVVLPLILVGVGQILYGVAFHTQPVIVEEESKSAPPPPVMVLPPGDNPDESAPPPEMREPPASPVAEKDFNTLDLAEPDLIRDVTVGGVARLDSGELKRTYMGRPPSLCPT